jgi:hypothetical protein
VIARLAKYDDLPEIAELGQRMIARSTWAHTTFDHRACMNRLLLALRSTHEWLAVVEHDGVITAAMLLTKQRYWWTADEYYVGDEAFYAERPGAGATLIKAGVKWAIQSGAKEIIFALNGGIDTERAVRVFNACGLKDRGICVSMRFVERGAQRWAA